MEFIFYLANTILCAWAIYWCLLRSGDKPGSPITGFFAWKSDPAKPAAAPRPQAKDPASRWTARR